MRVRQHLGRHRGVAMAGSSVGAAGRLELLRTSLQRLHRPDQLPDQAARFVLRQALQILAYGYNYAEFRVYRDSPANPGVSWYNHNVAGQFSFENPTEPWGGTGQCVPPLKGRSASPGWMRPMAPW